MIVVTVTKEDIRDGVRADPRNCPIARAIKRLGYLTVEVTHLIRIGNKRFSCPWRAFFAQWAWDLFGRMRPFRFTL